MLITGEDNVLVQGITGAQGLFWTEQMANCGTRIVAGVSPGKGGRSAARVPVYDTVAEATEHHEINVSVLFVPPLAAKSAAMEAIEAGVQKIVFLTEHVPYQDVMHVLAAAYENHAQILGPNTAGIVVPGQASLGIMPGFAENIFQPGNVGVISRSGSLGTLMALNLVTAGYGQSAFIGIGGDPILGTTMLDAVRTLDADRRTEAIVLVGEIGGAMEETAADYISEMSKPVAAFIAGRSAPPDRRMGHAGAIVTGNRGSGASKVRALTDAGVQVLDVPSQIGKALHDHGVVPQQL